MTVYVCSICGQRYDAGSFTMLQTPTCTGGGSHSAKDMKVRDDYQAVLDSLGIPADDPLREAT